MSNKIIKLLPFWETVGRSFKYVLKNKKLLLTLLPIVGLLAVIQVFFKLPLMCSYNEKLCVANWQHTASALILVITAVGIIINYCRSIICKETVDYTSPKFFKRLGFYIMWSVMLTFVIGIPLSLIIMIVSMTAISGNGVLAISLLLFFVFGVVFAPLIVAFPALAVDDYKKIKLSKLFSLAKGNKMSIFFGQVVVMVPYIIVSKALIYIYTVMATSNYAVNLIFVILTIMIGLLDAGFKGAFFAHIYQFLKYYDKEK